MLLSSSVGVFPVLLLRDAVSSRLSFQCFAGFRIVTIHAISKVEHVVITLLRCNYRPIDPWYIFAIVVSPLMKCQAFMRQWGSKESLS